VFDPTLVVTHLYGIPTTSPSDPNLPYGLGFGRRTGGADVFCEVVFKRLRPHASRGIRSILSALSKQRLSRKPSLMTLVLLHDVKE
jgi:hypothetical protein